MSKQFFFGIFKPAWDKAFCKETIQAAFRKTGIWPTDGIELLQKIARPIPSTPQKTLKLRSPKSAKAIRRFHAAYDKSPTVDKVKLLFLTTLRLAAQVLVLQHQNCGLERAINIQKRKNRQGVRLNLYRVLNKDIINYYSPRQVVKAREYQEEKEANAVVEEAAKY